MMMFILILCVTDNSEHGTASASELSFSQ